MSWASRKLLINFVTDMSSRARSHPLDRSLAAAQGFQPPTDIYETTDALVVRMELAGISPAEIELWVDEGAGKLTVRGQRADPARFDQRRYYNVEIECGPFARVVQLPRPIAGESATAAYQDGFLVIRLPKRQAQPHSPRSVPIE